MRVAPQTGRRTGPAGPTYPVRLAGIDAPEHDQAFGAEATRHLTELIAGKTVNLECENERSYDRLICKILLDGEEVCLNQVKAGMAWRYKQYEDEQSPSDRAAYAAAECTAMKERRVSPSVMLTTLTFMAAGGSVVSGKAAPESEKFTLAGAAGTVVISLRSGAAKRSAKASSKAPAAKQSPATPIIAR